TPKWLGIGQMRKRPARGRHRRLNARVLALGQQSGGKGAFRRRSSALQPQRSNDLLVYRDVIEARRAEKVKIVDYRRQAAILRAVHAVHLLGKGAPLRTFSVGAFAGALRGPRRLLR